MYNISAVKQEIGKWILDVLSKENPIFGGLPPCPYAKKAWLEGRVAVHIVKDTTDYSLTKENLDAGNDVIVYIFNPATITPKELTNLTLELNKTYPELLFLEDHLDEVEKVQDFVCNQGKYACIFAAKRDGVLQAREHLKTTNYYDNWDKEYKQEVWSR